MSTIRNRYAVVQYAIRRPVLAAAEGVIVEQERQIARLAEACRAAYVFIDRSCRPGNRAGAQGQIVNLLRAALAEVETVESK